MIRDPRDEPAFPRDHRHQGHNGMTLRDWFAGMALGGIPIGETSPIDAAAAAYEMADPMLDQRAELDEINAIRGRYE